MFKLKRIILFGFISVVANAKLIAQVPSGFKPVKEITELKELLIKENKKINTTESDFIQEKYISVLSEKIVSKGHFYFKKTNALRWEYYAPFNYLIVLNSGKMYIKDGDKVSKYNSSANKVFKGINDMMMSMVSGDLFNSPDYKCNYYINTTQYLLELRPLDASTQKFLETIQISINKSDFSVINVKMIEPQGDYTYIRFVNRKNNVPISDAKFKI